MWRTGARGAQVSPDPWGDEEPIINDEVLPDKPPPPPPSPPREPKPKTPPKTNGEVKTNGVNGVIKTDKKKNRIEPEEVELKKQPEVPFVYTKSHNEKEAADASNLDQYINKRFNNGHAWRPYLWERKQNMLLAGPVKPSKGFGYTMKNKYNSFKISWGEFKYSIEIWRSSIKSIEGHQGTGVTSYFVFLRWLFFLNIFIFMMLFWGVTFFQAAFSTAGYDRSTAGYVESTGAALYSENTACSAAYSPNVTYATFDLILDFVQGTGWMEETAMFYGFYTNEEVSLAVSEYNMPLAYFLITVIVMLVSLIVMVHNTLSNFKDTVLLQGSSKQGKYNNLVFAGMDYSVDEDEAMRLKQKSIYTGLVSELNEQRHEREAKLRTSGEKCKIWTIRGFINFLILLMLGGAGAAIYYAQDYSTKFTTASNVNDYNSFVILLVEFLPSIVIGLLNGILPFIFNILVEFENYKPAFVIKITLIRTVFLRLASLAMVVISLYVQVTCNTHDACQVGNGDCAAIQCWETYVGSALYKLLVMGFIVDVAVTLLVELPRKIITTKCDCGLAKKIGPAIFDIPKNVLDIVNVQMLCWLGFFFAPLIPAVVVFRFFVLFYLKKLSALYNTVPPEKPYQASKSNSFFMFILMVSYFLISIPVGYVISNLEPSPMCGPFRIYSYPSNIIDVQINNAGQWFQTIWEIVTSPGVISAVILLLSLALYYCSALNSAHKELVEMMRDQLVMEGKDKQFLMAKIAELSGAPVKKKVPPPPKMKTVDETQKSEKRQFQDVGIEKHELPLYGKEKSIVMSPVNNAPPPPAYDPPYVSPSNQIGQSGGTTQQVHQTSNQNTDDNMADW